MEPSDEERIKELEARALVDRDLIDNLQEQALDDQHKITGLETALVSSRRIGMALGILMDSLKITDDEAFDLLSYASQYAHRKLRDLAEGVIRTGTIDPA